MRRATSWLFGAVVLVSTLIVASTATAQDPASLTSRPLLTIVTLGLLTLVPFIFMTATSFVKISIVFSILRNALGTGQVPSGTVVSALAAILTLYVMAPVGSQIADAVAPSVAHVNVNDPLAGDSADAVFSAVRDGKEPLRRFLKNNANPREMRLFLDLARRARPVDQRASITGDDFLVVLPAFLITELAEAFQIGFLVFIPFLVVDMVIANVLLALGMHMLSPTTVSLPFKLLLFVLVDGWYLLARALVLGYHTG
ncbi:MAG: type III secretion system export apparatus subunit SctR [Sandaracinaceae bacterium]|jgi:type III secretion protein R|nr:type III secretion system export apparatus subunit SctR [Sandaracinaceae bacterium]